MPMDMGLMALAMIVVAVIVAVAIGVVVYGAIRAARAPRSEVEDARAVLDRRLASGDITPEEYYERESALRSGEVAPPRRRRRRG
jgi:uncharacterized membrane protein